MFTFANALEIKYFLPEVCVCSRKYSSQAIQRSSGESYAVSQKPAYFQLIRLPHFSLEQGKNIVRAAPSAR